jgi:ABC-type Fe3+ transport system permease subunit
MTDSSVAPIPDTTTAQYKLRSVKRGKRRRKPKWAEIWNWILLLWSVILCALLLICATVLVSVGVDLPNVLANLGGAFSP